MADIVSRLPATDFADGPVSPGTAASVSQLMGGVYNVTPPTLANTQQASIQFDVNGNLKTTSLVPNNSTRPELSVYASLGTAFCVTTVALTVATALTNLIHINNPNGSGKTLYLAAAFLTTAIGQSNWAQFNFYQNPTTTANGTSATIFNLLAGSATASVVSVFTGPSTSATGQLINISAYGGSNSAPTAESETDNLIPYIIIPPNNKFLLAGTAKSNGTAVNIILKWFEV